MQKTLYKSVFCVVFGLLLGITAFAETSGYVVYDEAAFNEAADQTRVYFFHAGWCPTCRSLDRDINANLDRIPEDVVIFRIDYDTSRQLKRRYGVTYQHTLVVVDAEGELVHKWTGGDFNHVLEELADL